jgi:hypothetical protein
MATEPVRVDHETKEQIENICEEDEDMCEAADRVARIGLREVSGPVSCVIRERAIDAAYHLTLIAVVVALAGVTTGLMTTGRGMAVALVIMSVGAAPVAAIESAGLLGRLRGEN